jgi:hypothetical protein
MTLLHGRPQHDWVSRAALKIIHARRLQAIQSAAAAATTTDADADPTIATAASSVTEDSANATASAAAAATSDADAVTANMGGVSLSTAKQAKEEFDDSEVLTLARAIVDELTSGQSDPSVGLTVAAARVGPGGQVLITSAAGFSNRSVFGSTSAALSLSPSPDMS